MDRTIGAPLALVLTLAACGQAPTQGNEANAATTGSVVVRMDNNATAPADAAPGTSRPALTDEAERGEKGARNLLLSFARAIEQKNYDAAWHLLSPADQEKWSKAGFAALFAGLGKVSVAVPAGRLEGAAGSSYYSASISITGSGASESSQRIEGEAILRRVNDVDGATAAERTWHFETLTIHPTRG